MHDPTHEYDENCEGCQPAMMDIKTGEVLPNDHPSMVIVLAHFKTLSLADRRAWHRVCVQSSQNEKDLDIARKISFDIAQALTEQDDADSAST